MQQPRVGRARVELLALGAIVVVAAVLRLLWLPTRGPFDSDQGHDMLMLHGLVVDGVVPLLGPPTSIGDFHHGALYYYLLAPAAWLGGGSPTVVVGEIALLGVAAVGIVWWLARSIAGPAAGLVAALLLAVSAASVDESTFIWNPNLIPFFSALAVAGAWQAWRTRAAAWWLVAAFGTLATMQCHVLGATLVVPMAALWFADARRSHGRDRRPVLAAGLGALVIVAAGYVPLLVHELTSDWSEVRAALEFVSGGGSESTLDPVSRLLFVMTRVLSWPLVGLATDAIVLAVVVAAGLVGILAWRLVAPADANERVAMRWLAGTLAWSIVVLAFAASGLSTVVEALPVDHYHAFLDPIVVVVAGVGIAALWRSGAEAAAAAGDATRGEAAHGEAARGEAAQASRARGLPAGTVGTAGLVARAAAIAALIGLAAWNLSIQPAPVYRDGGWPAAHDAAGRIGGSTGERTVGLLSVPDFKTAEGYEYPLLYDGRTIEDPASAGGVVVVCDTKWEEIVGLACRGPAEDEALAGLGRSLELVDRFEAAPDRIISVYLPG